jgi:uncharacterized protein
MAVAPNDRSGASIMSNRPSSGTALITGASSGIGAVYAEHLARRGHDLLLVARDTTRLAALADRIVAETGRKVDVLAADLGSDGDLAVVETQLRQNPAITLLVNNAGLLVNGPLGHADPASLTALLAVNVTALTRLAAAAAAAFAARGEGAIVNVSSAMAFIDTPASAVYAASKAYVLNLSLSLDLELRPQGVAVQAVLPGYTRTPMIGGGAGIPPQAMMEVEDLVRAALAGLDAGELVTIPSLEDRALYANWIDSRAALQPHLSLARPAARYGAGARSST